MSDSFPKPDWQTDDGRIRLYCGDCLEMLPKLPSGCVDAVVTDPPWGINGGSGTIGSKSLKVRYEANFDDTEEYVRTVCVPAVEMSLKNANRGGVLPGSPCCFLYPRPTDIGIVYQPAATGLGKWGRETSQPVLFYGRDPRAGKTIQPKHVIATRPAEKCGFPCPKPLYVMSWLVLRTSLDGETILDPFMGSGTTGVACIQTGRQFIGIEKEPKYFDIAVSRIKKALREQREKLFT